MVFYTLAGLRGDLVAELPGGVGGAAQTTYLNQAIRDAVAYAGTWVKDTARLDFVGDGVTRRFALVGVDCDLADAAYQEAPVGLNTAAIAGPTVAPALTASGSGSTFTAGTWYVGYEFTDGLGRTNVSAIASIALAAGQNIVTAALTLPAGITGVKWYVAPAAQNPDIQLAATVASGATQTFTGPPSASAGRPLKDFIGLFTYNPSTQLEQDVAVDGTAAVGTATLTLGTAPALHDRFRAVYTCKPALPSLDTDTIRVAEQTIRVVALMFAHRTLAYVHESGDTTQHLDAYQKLDLLVQDMQKKTPSRPRPRPRMPSPTT